MAFKDRGKEFTGLDTTLTGLGTDEMELGLGIECIEFGDMDGMECDMEYIKFGARLFSILTSPGNCFGDGFPYAIWYDILEFWKELVK